VEKRVACFRWGVRIVVYRIDTLLSDIVEVLPVEIEVFCLVVGLRAFKRALKVGVKAITSDDLLRNYRPDSRVVL
jgi:hypothetical protein